MSNVNEDIGNDLIQAAKKGDIKDSFTLGC